MLIKMICFTSLKIKWGEIHFRVLEIGNFPHGKENEEELEMGGMGDVKI